MFSAPIDLSVFDTEDDAFDHLYTCFQRDFVKQKTCLCETIYVDPKGRGVNRGREEVFWHITTREVVRRVKEGNRVVPIKSRPLDPDRASRIDWIRPILLNYKNDDIKLFYRKETKGKKQVRLYLWAHEYDFVVIVQKLGASDAFLVTSFYITETYKRDSYSKWHDEYIKGIHPELQHCEWC